MFTNPLPKSEKLLKVQFEDYANSHYLKSFIKKYPGKQWEATEHSIREDLSRLRMENNTTQYSSQIDELKHKGEYWLAKYDFRVAKTKESSKSSGNRCVVLIDDASDRLSILLIYGKTDLPKNKDETVYIYDEIAKQYSDIDELFKN